METRSATGMRDMNLSPAQNAASQTTAARPAPSTPSGFTPPQAPLKRPWYAPAGDLIRKLLPGLFPPLREARRQVWRQARIGLFWLAAFAVLALMAFVVAGPGPFGSRLVLGAAGAGLAGLAGLGALALRLRSHLRALSAENRRLAREIAHIHDLAVGREARVDRVIAAQVDSQLRGMGSDELRAVRGRIDAIASAQIKSEAKIDALAKRLDDAAGRLNRLQP
jgi:hypothetical protein